jgi:hypothetical protein
MRRIVTAVIVVAVLAVGGLAYAEGQPADPSVPSREGQSAPPAAAGAAKPRPARQLLQGAIHGELLVRDPVSSGSTRTIVFDRGRLTSVSEGSIALQRPDGVPVTAAVTPDTAFNGTPREQLKPGVTVIVAQSGGVAERVVSKGAAAAAGAKACQARPRLCPRLRANSDAPAGTF